MLIENNIPKDLYRLIRFGFGAFLIGFAAVVIGFVAMHYKIKWLIALSFATTVIAVILGATCVAIGWYRHAREAIRGSWNAAKRIRSIIFGGKR